MSSNKRLLMMAALLASSTAVDFDSTVPDGLNIRAQFEQEESNEIVTADAYRIQIDRVAIPAGELDGRPRNQDDLDRILSQLERPTIDITPGYELEPQEASLVLTNARFEGRVFDESGERLPDAGLGISGELPLNVRVVRTGEVDRPLDVRFELSRRFFDGVDWSYAGGIT
jgi:hypothetical protein